MSFAVVLQRLAFGILSSLIGALQHLLVYIADFTLVLYNLVTPNLQEGHVVPEGFPGHGGRWPAYVAPKPGDSRGSCPALNAMANHGILPHDGKNIKYADMPELIFKTFNFAPTFGFFVGNYAADMLHRSYWTDAFDLADFDAHNCIEHDASLSRVDSHEDPDQSKIAHHLVDRVLNCGTGPGGDLTAADISRLLGERRVESKRHNPTFSQASAHKMFASSNAATLLTIFGGRKKDLEPFLKEERLPEKWESRIRHRMGLTMAEFNLTTVQVELGVHEEVNGSIQAAGQERYRKQRTKKTA